MRRGGRYTGLLGGQDVLTPQLQRIVINGSAGLSAPARDSYQTLMVMLEPPSVPGYYVVANWTNFSTGQLFGSTNAVMQSNLAPTTLLGPMSCNPGDNVGCNLLMFPGSAISLPVRLFGIRERLVTCRPDGRPYPTGAAGAWVNVAAPQALIPAPGAGLCVMLSSLTMTGFAVNATGNIQITQNGILYVVQALDGGAGNVGPATPQPIPPQGLLCDENTAVNLAISAGSIYAAVTYDLTQ